MQDSSEREPAQGPALSVDKVFSRARGVFGRHWGAFLGGGFLLLIGFVVVEAAILFASFQMRADAWAFVAIVPLIGLFLWSVLLNGFVFFTAVSDFSGRKVSFGKSLGAAFVHAPDLLMIQIIQLLCLGVGGLLVIPGLFAAVVLSVAGPVRVVERHGVVASLVRSVLLTEGVRWRVLAVLAIMLLANILATVGWSALSLMSRPGGEPGPFAPAAQLLMLVLVILQNVGNAVTVAALYAELRLTKESHTLGTVEKVFD